MWDLLGSPGRTLWSDVGDQGGRKTLDGRTGSELPSSSIVSVVSDLSLSGVGVVVSSEYGVGWWGKEVLGLGATW